MFRTSKLPASVILIFAAALMPFLSVCQGADPSPTIPATTPPTPTPTIIAPTPTPTITAPAPTPTPTITAPAPTPTLTTSVTEYDASVSDDNSLIVWVNVKLTSEAGVFVEYENAVAGRFRTALSEAASEHAIPVARLRPETTYSYTINLVDADGGATFGPGGEFTTGSLPDALADIRQKVTGKSSQPLLMSDYRTSAHAYIVIRDDAGEIVWYYGDVPPEPEMNPSVGPIARKRNGNFIYLSRGCCIKEITPLGASVDRLDYNEIDGVAHHDLDPLGDDRILYLSRKIEIFDDSKNGGDIETPVRTDELQIWDQSAGRTERIWRAMDFWDPADPNQRVTWSPRDDGWNWTHTNSVSFGSRGNVILSVNHRNQIISLSPDFQSIEWQLGGPDSDYTFPNPDDQFYFAHTATELPNGNILLFDNGRSRPEAHGGLYSRALELRLDNSTMTAVKVWEYRHTPDIYAVSRSSAYRLSNGNTLVDFANDDAVDRRVIVEVAPSGQEVFHLEIAVPDPTHGNYRAYGDIDSILGETKLPPRQ